MKILNLIEDTPGDAGYLYEHGLSFYIETAHHKVLLDTGASDAFLRNAHRRGVDLGTVDTLMISHGHYDHTGGIRAFAACNPNAVIYLQKNADGAFYNCRYPEPKLIGMDDRIRELRQVVFLDGNRKIDDELSVFTGVTGNRCRPRGNETLKRRCGDTFVCDSFDHEQYLVVTEGQQSVLLSGCAHNGILNILDTYRQLYGGTPTCVISGFHTVLPEYTAADDALIRETAHALAKMDTRFYTGHCTGEHALGIFSEIMGSRLVTLHSGDWLL